MVNYIHVLHTIDQCTKLNRGGGGGRSKNRILGNYRTTVINGKTANFGVVKQILAVIGYRLDYI